MKLKRLLSVILLSAFLVSVCSFSSFGADLTPNDFTALLYRETPNDSGGTTSVAYSFTTKNGYMGGQSVVEYRPNDSSFFDTGATRLLSAFTPQNLVAGHDYTFSFGAGSSFGSPTIIVKMNGDTLFSKRYSGGGLRLISVSFTAPDGDSSVYLTVEVSVASSQPAAGDARFTLTQEMTLNDDTDNPGWLGKILQNFTNLGDRISGFFSNLGESIGNFFADLKQSIVNQFNNVKQWFIDLGDDIKGFFTSLKNYLLYFEDPVTLDPNGVPIGADGKPVYINPFASKIDEFEQTINGWLTQIQNFVNQIGSAGSSVSSYIENGSSVVTGVLGAVPVLTAVLTFALVLLVVRKVVGR